MTYVTGIYRLEDKIIVKEGSQIIPQYRVINEDGLPIVALITGNPAGAYSLPNPIALHSPVAIVGGYTAAKMNAALVPVHQNQAMFLRKTNDLIRVLQDVGIVRLS